MILMYSSVKLGLSARMAERVSAVQNKLRTDKRVRLVKSTRFERDSIPSDGKMARSEDKVSNREESFGAAGNNGRSVWVKCGWTGVLCGGAKESENAVRLGKAGEFARSSMPCCKPMQNYVWQTRLAEL